MGNFSPGVTRETCASLLDRNNGLNHAHVTSEPDAHEPDDADRREVALTADTPSTRDRLMALVAAHGALTTAVTEAARLMAAHGHGQYAEYLDHHRAELNVAIGELALWVESFGIWADVEIGKEIHPPVSVLTAGTAPQTPSRQTCWRRGRRSKRSAQTPSPDRPRPGRP